MEGKNTQNTTKVFEIPVEDYEEYMNKDSSKENKNEILDLFKNHNQLKSQSELDEIKYKLCYACEKCDLDLIKILLSETTQDATNDLTFKIDKTNYTASLFKINSNLENLLIPRTVKHEMNDYLVTSITSIDSSKIKIIKFEEDSSVSTIYGCAFSESTIQEIYFPKSLNELKEGWCKDTQYLKKIIISPSNGQFIFKDDQYLLSKSDIKNDEFDILSFVRRDIKEISIPSNIKIIGSYSFEYSSITNIFIPSSLTKICEYAFYGCFNLRKFEIPMNSNLQTIESSAFSGSKIEEIYFPKSLNELKEGWCKDTQYLKKIIISPSNGQFIFKDDQYLLCKSDINKDEFDILLFVRRDIEEISIPSNIKTIGSYSFEYSNIINIFIPSNVTKICEYAFSDCFNLRKVEIPTNSNLQTIESFAFSRSKIEEISIPSSLTKICENAFSDCFKLRKFEIPTNSNLQTIESSVFSGSKIEEICFPKSLNELKEGWCKNTQYLKKIIISPSNGQFIFKDDQYLLSKSDIKNDEFDILLFVRRDIKEISIPSNIKIIGSYSFKYSSITNIFIPSNVTKIREYAFSDCFDLRKVEIPTNSNLQTIESSAFAGSKIEEIFIPSSLTKICENEFSDCFNLRKVEIPTNSNLQTIESFAFSRSKIEEISIPSSLTKICEYAFYNCSNLRKVEIPTNSNLQTIESSAFSGSEIEEIFIPSSLTKICEYAFSNCTELRIIETSEESKLQSIPESAFEGCPKLIIMIPISSKKLIQTINST